MIGGFSLQKSEEGITSRISFNDKLERSYFVLEIVEYSFADGLKKIATWDPDKKITPIQTSEEVQAKISQSLQNKTLIVTTRTGMPYMRIKQVI